MIEIRNLVVLKNDKTLLDKISIKWKNGMRYGIYGDGGAGKTALLDCLAGACAIREGDVLINGFEIRSEPLKAREFIGYLPQDAAVYKSMTPVEYLLYIADLKGMGYEKAVRAVGVLLDEAGVSPRRDCLIKNLSVFEQKCLGVAQTALGKSDILIFDDPFVALSPREIQRLQSFMEFLSDGKTLIVSARKREHIEPLCDRLFSLSNGTLVEDELRIVTSEKEGKEDQ